MITQNRKIRGHLEKSIKRRKSVEVEFKGGDDDMLPEGCVWSSD